MDALKKFGAVFSNHYEKFILAVILIALLGAAAFLPFRVAQSRDTIREALAQSARKAKKETKPVDTAEHEAMLKRSRTAPKLELSGEHNLFNPVVWKKGRDGNLFKVVKGDEEGPGGLSVKEIRPLYLTIAYEGPQAAADSVRYRFSILDESKSGRSARPRPVFASIGSAGKTDPFVVTRIVAGPPDNPTSIEIRFADSTETAVLTTEQPFKRIAGYEADLQHEKVGSRFNNVRAKQQGGIRLGSQTYNIVAITKDEVTVQSNTQKRWTVGRKGTSQK